MSAACLLAFVHAFMLALSITVLKFIANLPKVGSKLDKALSRAVKYEEGEALANKHGSHFCEASAKTRENVRKPFVDVVDQIVKSPHLTESASRQTRGSVLVGGGIPEPSGCSC
jgi:Ras-related protein Rab-18